MHILIFNMRELVTSLSLLESDKFVISILLIAYETFFMKLASSSLFITMENLNESIFSSLIAIDTMRGAWRDANLDRQNDY